jgi:hypothetical protein
MQEGCVEPSVDWEDLFIYSLSSTEDKVDLISRAFTRERKTFTKLCEVKVSLSLSEGTLLYSWGSANRGKLGLS